MRRVLLRQVGLSALLILLFFIGTYIAGGFIWMIGGGG